MSNILDLIAQHCPEGVEHKTLGELGTFTRGNGMQKKHLLANGARAIHYGQIFTHYGTSAAETKSFVDEGLAQRLRKAKTGDLIIATTSENDEDVCKAVAWLGQGEVAVSGDAYIYSHFLNPLYAAYLFQSSDFQSQKARYVSGTKVRRVSGADLARIRVPVPPMDVQRAIAEILDKMERLEAELEAELAARTRQYKHYRDTLLTFERGGQVQWSRLAELATNHDSKRKPITKAARIPGPYPYYGASGVVDSVADFIFEGSYLLVSEDGANLLARSTPIAFSISGKNWVNNHAHVLEFDGYVQQRFVEYYLNSIDLRPYLTGATQPKLNKAKLNAIPIPTPDFSEQERIVAVLDKFDALVGDISLGLPAEIAARRKQYAYYRDLLLTFPEKKAA